MFSHHSIHARETLNKLFTPVFIPPYSCQFNVQVSHILPQIKQITPDCFRSDQSNRFYIKLVMII